MPNRTGKVRTFRNGPVTRSASKTLRFTHVALRNWRNFTAVEVPLQRRGFLIGPNASGKSNFLDAFRFVLDIASVGGGFQEAVRRRGGVSKLRSLAARRYPDVTLRMKMGSDEDPAAWEYELSFNQDKLRHPLVRQEKVTRGSETLLDRPNELDRADPERLTQTYLEQVNVNREFREVAAFFEGIRYLHIVPQLVRDPERSVGRRNDPYGGDFLEQVARTQERTQRARLRRIREALSVAVPQLSELELTRDERGTPHLRGRYVHWRPLGAWQAEDQFSDGTLRLLGLLWAVLDGSGPLLLEEPELSLHPDVVRHVPQMFARVQRRTGRQIIVSTHSTDLLLDEGIGLNEVLLLQPGENGTEVRVATAFQEIMELVEAGVSLPEAVIPHTRPGRAQQLMLFGD